MDKTVQFIECQIFWLEYKIQYLETLIKNGEVTDESFSKGEICGYRIVVSWTQTMLENLEREINDYQK